MMDDICNFIPRHGVREGIEYFHFVYEANIKRLKQPFIRPNFYAHLVFRGNGVLKTNGKEQKLVPGTLFFTYPYQSFEIDCTDEFSYLYISFNGPGAEKLLEKFRISKNNCIFASFGNLTEFWMSAIRRINPSNADTLTESVLLYTLSFIDSTQKADKFEAILEYIKNNYTDPTLTILKIADIFFYNKKYLSALFLKRTDVKFKEYINNLRMQRALSLINDRSLSIAELAQSCGFSDPLYFSKVFKKATGYTPTEYHNHQ
ncbi:MAG: helix-turn-helix domain-containing protein [Clostridia bacterium]|nr:helix-turn-helix domain-containing protein [Clostridia bacterium]